MVEKENGPGQQQMPARMEAMQAHCWRLEEERNLLMEINERRVREMERRFEEVEKEREKERIRREEDAEQERREWRRKQEEFRDEVRALVERKADGRAEAAAREKEEKIEELKKELAGLHTFYKDQISMIEKNYAESSFNNGTRLENMQNQSHEFSQRDPEKRVGTAEGNEMLLMDDHSAAQSAQGLPGAGPAYGDPSESLEAIN